MMTEPVEIEWLVSRDGHVPGERQTVDGRSPAFMRWLEYGWVRVIERQEPGEL